VILLSVYKQDQCPVSLFNFVPFLKLALSPALVVWGCAVNRNSKDDVS